MYTSSKPGSRIRISFALETLASLRLARLAPEVPGTGVRSAGATAGRAARGSKLS